MKKWLIPAIIGVVIIGVVMVTVARKKKEQKKEKYTFTEVQRGSIENTVSATGTLEPVTSVNVGTQVSGIIDRLYVDFNDKVKKNQLLAVLDTTLLSVQVRDAKSSLLRSKSQYDQARYNYERTEKLYKDSLLSELEYVTSKTSYESALASVQSAQISLERADRNMAYAFIRAPIDGTVIYREVEEGQTVASSFQTPNLFIIAEDLSKMEIHAVVDESDIGLIKEGQSVRFEVQAYDNKTFTGTVRQVWLQPQTVQNVVNYTVVVDASNPDGLLLPGMTASLDFVIEDKQDVLLVASAALKIQPSQEMMDVMQKRMQERFGNRSDSTRGGQGRNGGFSGGQMPQGGFPSVGMGQGGGFGQSRSGSGSGNFGTLWYLDEKNQLQMQPVRTGTTDGK
ncbi:efflux RND transporter periplasmic adaptor subunit, partial [bacterium]